MFRKQSCPPAQSTNVKLQLLAPKVLTFFTQSTELWHPQIEVTFMELKSNANPAALTASHIISFQSHSSESFGVLFFKCYKQMSHRHYQLIFLFVIFTSALISRSPTIGMQEDTGEADRLIWISKTMDFSNIRPDLGVLHTQEWSTGLGLTDDCFKI